MRLQISRAIFLAFLLSLTCFVKPVLSQSFLEYTKDKLPECYVSETDQTSQALLMNDINRYMFIFICPITLLTTGLIIVTFIRYPGTRRSPGDLLLGLSICEFVLNLHWLVSAIYETQIDGEEPDEVFCQINSAVSIPAAAMDCIYNFMLTTYVWSSLKHSLRGYQPNTKYWHVALAVFAVALLAFLEVTKATGINFYGTCSFVASGSLMLISQSLFGFAFFAFGAHLARRFHQTSSSNERVRSKQMQFAIYFTYIKVTAGVFFVVAFLNIFIAFNCYGFHVPGLEVFISMANFCRLLQPSLLSVLRFRDPIIRNKIRLIRQSRALKKLKDHEDGSLVPLAANNNKLGSSGDHSARDMKEFNDSLRLVQLVSILCGVWQDICSSNRRQSSWGSNEGDFIEQLTQEHFEEQEDILLENDKDDKLDASIERLSLRMTVYSPEVFRRQRRADAEQFDFADCLDIGQNMTCIWRACSSRFGEGGASGEFFFATHDDKLLLKTINEGELNILRKKLPRFTDHYKQEPSSLIAKIYGVYSFQQLATYAKPEHVIVMRNIQGLDLMYVERRFDLKGSSLNRLVAASNQRKSLKELVLKDLDFKDYEQTIKAGSTKLSEISQTLEFDSNFLCGCGFMDYSLLVVKVNWGNYFRDKDRLRLHSSCDKDQSYKERLFKSIKDLSSSQIQNIFLTQPSQPTSRIATVTAVGQNNDHNTLISGGISRKTDLTENIPVEVMKSLENSKSTSMRNSDSSTNSVAISLSERVKKHFGGEEFIQFESTEQPGVFYHIAIIDYLQQWTLRKSLERILKNFLYCKNADTSAQPPRFYSDRFKNLVREIFQ